MSWLWIAFGLFALIMSLVFLAACKAGAEADERIEREFQAMMERRSQNAGGVLHEEVMEDAQKA